jgi:ketosteroid isomerase-like protein
MHPNAALVLQFYEARARDDRAAIREILGEDVAWHDPYPPPHGGDLRGIAAVFRDILDRAGTLTGASMQLAPVDVLAKDARAAIVEWSATYKGRTLHGRELALWPNSGCKHAAPSNLSHGSRMEFLTGAGVSSGRRLRIAR